MVINQLLTGMILQVVTTLHVQKLRCPSHYMLCNIFYEYFVAPKLYIREYITKTCTKTPFDELPKGTQKWSRIFHLKKHV